MKLFNRFLGYFPLRPLGLLVLALGLIAFLYYGGQQADFILKSAGLLLIGLVAIALVSVLVSMLQVLVMLSCVTNIVNAEAEHVQVGQAFSYVTLKKLRFYLLSEVSMHVTAPVSAKCEFEKREDRNLIEIIRFSERGRLSKIEQVVTVRDLFGLVAISWPFVRAVNLVVEPKKHACEFALELQDITGEGISHPQGQPEGDRVELRPYAPGDPLRFVLWKIYARTRRLVVRTPERALNPEPTALGCFIAGPNDELSASTARLLLEHGGFGQDFVFVASGAKSPARNKQGAIDDLIDSVEHRENAASNLAQLTAQVEAARLDNALFLVPDQPGEWLDGLRDFVKTLRRAPTIIVTTDEHREFHSKKQKMLERFLFAQTESQSRLPALYRELCKLGTVRVFHAQAGRELSAHEIEAWQ